MLSLLGAPLSSEARKLVLFKSGDRERVQELTRVARARGVPAARPMSRREASRVRRMLGDRDLRELLAATGDAHPVVLAERTERTHPERLAKLNLPTGTRLHERLLVKSGGLYREFEWKAPGKPRTHDTYGIDRLKGTGLLSSGPAEIQAWRLTPASAREAVGRWLDAQASRLAPEQTRVVRERIARTP